MSPLKRRELENSLKTTNMSNENVAFLKRSFWEIVSKITWLRELLMCLRQPLPVWQEGLHTPSCLGWSPVDNICEKKIKCQMMQNLRHQFQAAICVSIQSVKLTEMRKTHPVPACSFTQKMHDKHNTLKWALCDVTKATGTSTSLVEVPTDIQLALSPHAALFLLPSTLGKDKT